eukprot:scaffold1959_cov243-Pinguiococcus_pyrenoidosus.AAC.7
MPRKRRRPCYARPRPDLALRGGEVPDRAARDEALVEEATDGAHRKAAILNLLQLQGLEVRRVLAKLERIKAEVSRLADVHVQVADLAIVQLVLEEADEEEDLKQRLRADLVEGVHRVGLGVGLARQVDDGLHEHAQAGKHGDTPVLDLRLAQEVDIEDLQERCGVQRENPGSSSPAKEAGPSKLTLERPSGSNPTSPAMEPSSLGCFYSATK